MAIKFEIIGNNLVATDTDTSAVVFDEFAKESSYVSSQLDSGVVQVVYPITANKNPSQAFGDVIRYSVSLANSVDTNETPFTAATFRDFCRTNLGKSSGGSTSLSTYYGEYDNYNALVAAYPAGEAGRFAFVKNSQGTQWLPSTLGGTYYGAGWYYDTGSAWTNKNDAIFNGLQETTLTDRVVVNQGNVATTLGGTIDSTKQYYIDGSIDMTGVTVTIPSTGIFLKGLNLDLSKLICSDNSYTMFDGATAGNVFVQDLSFEVTGTASQVFDLTDATGSNAVELVRVNFNNCTAVGEFNGYRQGLENNTGRFRGTPEMTLSGTWLGGYFIETSIVRSLTDGGYALYKAGTGFTMNSRFRTNQNIDLPANASFFDFAPSNFVNPSTVQVTGALVSRNGVFDSTDSNITPNITQADLVSAWSGNVGMPNTFEGGRLTVTSENLTTIGAGSTWYTLNAIWTASNLEHFDSPAAGQLRHLGNSPREYKCIINFAIESTANNDLGIRLRKYDDSAASFVDFTERRRQVNNLVGGRDVAIFNFSFNVSLDQNDYVFFQVRNNSGNNNLTLELNSDWLLEER